VDADRRRAVPAPCFAEIEYRLPVGAGDEVELVSQVDGERLGVWLTAGADVAASALITT
jgi:hypothetical protein